MPFWKASERDNGRKRTPNNVILHVQDDSRVMDDSGDGKGKDRPGVPKVGTASGAMGMYPGLER